MPCQSRDVEDVVPYRFVRTVRIALYILFSFLTAHYGSTFIELTFITLDEPMSIAQVLIALSDSIFAFITLVILVVMNINNNKK